jgi:hypothetical protein
MIDDQVRGYQGIRQLRPRAGFFERIAHGGQIDHAGHAGKILQQNPRGTELDLLRRCLWIPFGNVLDIRRLDRAAILKSQQIL